jgi:hypothetical protein
MWCLCNSGICLDNAQTCHRRRLPAHLTNPELSLSLLLLVFICEYSWNLSYTNFSVSELKCESLRGQIAKHVGRQTSWIISPGFQILGDDRQAPVSHFIVQISPSPIKQTTPLMHISLIHYTFPIDTDKLAIDFGRTKVFYIQKSGHQVHITIGRIIDRLGYL